MRDIETPDKVEQPEVANAGEYEFNLGLYRIETLSEILNVCAKKYRTAIMRRDEESVLDYQAMVNTLYTETFIYIEHKTGIKEKQVEQDKEDIYQNTLDRFELENDTPVDRLKEVRKIYLSIRNVLQEAGIDIPRKEKMKETDTFSDK